MALPEMPICSPDFSAPLPCPASDPFTARSPPAFSVVSPMVEVVPLNVKAAPVLTFNAPLELSVPVEENAPPDEIAIVCVVSAVCSVPAIARRV